MSRPTLAALTAVYARIGALTFGGGDPTMAALQTELVRNRRWLAPERYVVAYAIARVTPGTNMLAFIAGTAWEMLGWRGAIAGVLVTTVPGAILVVLLSAGYDALRSHPRAMAAVAGTLAAAVGMMAIGAWQLIAAHITSRDWRLVLRAALLAGSALALSSRFDTSPVIVLALAALAGVLWLSPSART